jgi:hypothetical protein
VPLRKDAAVLCPKSSVVTTGTKTDVSDVPAIPFRQLLALFVATANDDLKNTFATIGDKLCKKSFVPFVDENACTVAVDVLLSCHLLLAVPSEKATIALVADVLLEAAST